MAARIADSLVALTLAHAVQAAAALFAAPVLVGRLGTDGYGLVALAVTLLPLFAVLDAGVSAALTRRFAAADRAAAALLAGAERLLAAAAAAVLLLGAVLAWPASAWLRSALPRAELAAGLALAVAAAAAQWPAHLYQAGLHGRGRQAEAALIQAGGALLRWGGAAGVAALAADVRAVLAWQAAAAAAAAWALRARLRRGLPRLPSSLTGIGGYVRDVSALALAATSFSVIDRIVGVAVLALGAFGAYTLAAQAAQTVGTAIATVRAVWFPRLAAALAAGAEAEAHRSLGDAVQIAALFVVPWSAVLALLPRALLFAWTGSAEVAAAGGALAGLGVGWGMVAVAWAVAILDLARGTVRRAGRLAAAAALVLLPAAGFGTGMGGAAGLGIATGAVLGLWAVAYLAGPGNPLGPHAGAVLRPFARTAAAAAAPPLLVALVPLPAGRLAAGLAVWAAWLGGTAAAALASATGRMAIGVALDRLGLRRSGR